MQYFSPWQIDRLRARLAAYRLNTGRDGKPKPWLDIAQEILDSDATALCLPEADEDPMTEHEPLASDNWVPDKDWPLKGENLRKFVEGERKQVSGVLRPTTLQKDKLQAVCDFLIDVEYFSERELRDEPVEHHAAYGVMEYFFESSAQPVQKIDDNQANLLTGEFGSCVISDKNIVESNIYIGRSGDKAVLLIKERRNIYRNPVKPAFASWRRQERKSYIELTKVLSGWGICFGASGFIVLFMKNADDGLEPQVYSGSVVKPRGEKGRSALTFVRAPLTRIPANYVQISEQEYKATLNLSDLGNDVFLFEKLATPPIDQDDLRTYQAPVNPAKRPRNTVVPFRKTGETKRDV